MAEGLADETSEHTSSAEALDRIERRLEDLTQRLDAYVREETSVQEPLQVLRRRMLDGFSAVYLTVASIIQGVTLGYLATSVEHQAHHLTATVWLEILAVFIVIVVGWYEFFTSAMTLSWIPDLFDAFTPFLFAAAELYAIYSIEADSTRWLGAMALIAAAGAIEYINQFRDPYRRARNRIVLSGLGSVWGPLAGYVGGALAIFGLFLLASSSAISGTSWILPAVVLAGVLTNTFVSIDNLAPLLRKIEGREAD